MSELLTDNFTVALGPVVGLDKQATVLQGRPMAGDTQWHAANNAPGVSGQQFHDSRGANRKESRLLADEKIAAILREFLQLTTGPGALSARQAAQALSRPLSWFAGQDSYLSRFKRHGLNGISGARGASRHSHALVLPPWFIPAAKYFYLLSNHRREGGSVPEAVLRAIELPNLPVGWNNAQRDKLANHLAPFYDPSDSPSLPTCPPELRAIIQTRFNKRQAIVPRSIAKLIAVPQALIQHHRSPRASALDNLSAPGSQRRYHNPQTGQREIMLPGDFFGGDDATPGIAVCLPCQEVLTPCSTKFGVLLGRFQWLAYHDARTDKILAHDYVIRPRGSYRAEDILNGMGAVVRLHGIPRRGWQFEGGSWNSKLIRHAIELMGVEHWRTYSPHQKAIESIFNRVWTKLAVQFPHADMGRYRNENEENCKLYEDCKAGHKDPRKYFPTIEIVLAAFEAEIAAHNTKLIVSSQYGQWIPDDLFAQYCGGRDSLSPQGDGAAADEFNGRRGASLRQFSEEMQWIFSPFTAERQIHGAMVSCKVKMFEDFSVPFDFSAPWMPLHRGCKVRLHFNPREPKCRAKIILLENSGTVNAGTILGDADLVGETAQHIRRILDWAQDDQRAGYLVRQKTAQFLSRHTRAIGPRGRVEYSADERRDGLGQVAKIERSTPRTAGVSPASSGTVPVPVPDPTDQSDPSDKKAERAERLAQLETLAKQTRF